MFVNEKLQQYLETSSSINSQPLVIGEWNMNVAENISTVGNYRHRPTATPDSPDFVYATPANFFDINDGINNGVKFYSGATDADIIVDGGLDNNDQPVAFTVPNEKERLLYSLEDCFRRFRPRSGINKLRYFEDNYTHFVNSNLTNRPRYYMASRNDSFKYWTSYRKEANVERGIANKPVGALFYIDDAAPFITYKEPIPSNKIVVKMQTGVGDVDLGPFTGGGSSFDDPFFGESNKATPNNWSIQILKDNNWIDAISFNPLSLRKDDTQVIKSDGYVEITYGLIVPDKYESKIHFAGKYPFASLLPVSPAENSAYFVQESDNELGMVYFWNGTEYESFTPSYGWRLGEESVSEETHLVNNFVNPEYFIDSASGNQKYKEFEYIQGIRVVAKTMNKINSTFDLLELSPRLTANLTERTSKFSFNKSASDLGVSGMPVGQLLASNGSLDIFDYDDAFNKNNTSSILSKFTSNNLQVKLFETIYEIDNNVVESYHIPLKTLYADGFPESSSNTRSFSVQLRDMFFYFESLNSPQLLVESASLGYAVSFLLDSVGFSNYTFRRVDEEDDPVIPYFFVKPETSVAQVLQELAVATQTAMFFDEFNNLIVMSKNYMMPSLEERPTDIEILGSLDQAKQGVVKNLPTKTKLSNIISLSSKNQEVFNDGKITFEEKYIAKTYGSLKEASLLNQDQNWIYKPALLWEVSGTPPLRSIEGDQDKTSSYTLAAIPLNSDLSDVKPYVQNNEVQNNIMDFGEGAYWVARYNGYLYANGEIIKYDAVEYNVSGIGNVWVSSLREYQSYFSKIKFGGKIYPTGRVRIYSEPFYEEIGDTVVIKNGSVRKDGREQFGTKIAYHNAGLPAYWSDTSASSPVRGIEMDSDYLFKTFTDGKVDGIHNQSVLSLEVAIDVEEPSIMRSVVYADGKWVGVGNDGKFRTSVDAETWETVVDEEFANSFVFNSIAYGSGPESSTRWIAAGHKISGGDVVAAMAYSTDAETWVEIPLSLEFSRIEKIIFADNLWMVVGNSGGIATSSDGDTWANKISKLDYSVNTSKSKILSSTTSDGAISISKVEIGTPAVFTRKNHGLRENDKLRLSTTGTLPSGFNNSDTYYVSYRSKDTFALKTSTLSSTINTLTIGTGRHRYTKLAAKFKISRHGLLENDPIRIIASGAMPSGLSENTVYRVRVVDSDNVHLSTSVGGALIDFVSSQSKTIHKVERFVRTKINSVAYGDGKWVVVGDNGSLSSSTNTNDWTAIDAKFDSTNIFDIHYANSVWFAVGASGKARTSSNLISWSSRNVKIKSDLNTVHYSTPAWIVAGVGGKASRSTNLTSWKVTDVKFGDNTVNQIRWQNKWLAVGQKLKLSTSIDGITWTNNSQENVGELKFTTSIPHEFTPFDTVRLTSTGSLPEDAEKTLTSISIANPAVLTYTDHKLNDNDQIKLTTNGALPTGLVVNTIYYVKKINDNSFNLKASGTSSSPLIATTGSDSGTHSFFRPPLEASKTYYVTPKNISENSFTLADSRENARLGISATGSGSENGIHKISLYTVAEKLTVSSISLNANNHVLINLANVSSLQQGDRVFFGVDSPNGFVDKRISRGIVRYAPYYIHSMISNTQFSLSENFLGDPYIGNEDIVTLSAGENFSVILNLTEDIIKNTIITPSFVNLQPGNLIEIESGEGELSSPTRVAVTRSANSIKKTISSISIANTAIISATGHGLFNMDEITFTTTGTLPHGIDSKIRYYVQKINDNSFGLLDEDLLPVGTKEGTIPDTENLQYRVQSGTHSFSKSINDKNKIVLTRAVSKEIKQYKVSQQDILVDIEDGETRKVDVYEDISYKNSISVIEELEIIKSGKAGSSTQNNTLARSASRNGIIKNFLTKSSFSETDTNKFLSTQTGTIQSSAFIFDGPSFDFESGQNAKDPIDFLSYIYKPLNNKFSHFGTRMRIIGRISQEESEQIIYNSLNYFLNPESSLDEQFSIYGGSAGLGVMVNPETNIGYYFEIIALSQSNLAESSEDVGLFNVVFYKVVRKVSSEGEPATSDSSKAIPIKLFQGITNVVADDGTMVGQFRMANEESPSVYDVAVEYEDVDENTRKFYLLINNKIIAVVDDTDPLPVHNNMALFVRGGTRAMFENVYAVANNYSQNTVFELDPPVNSVFGTNKIDVSQSFRKYALSGSVQASYLSGIASGDVPQYNIYFEEFGTIMRECAYFNIKYDKAYPALYAKLSETFNKMKGYTVSGFVPSAYGAEFLVFNNTDTALNLDETSGNYLRIQGVTFTQSTQKELTVDDYFDRVSNFSDPEFSEDGIIVSPIKAKQDFLDIKNSRITYGKKEFNISSAYIQSQDEASNLMSWIISKIMKPRKSIGLQVFGMPTLQLGDIVSIDYTSNDSIEQISLRDSRFVVYNIEYSRSLDGPSMNVFLSEVI